MPPGEQSSTQSTSSGPWKFAEKYLEKGLTDAERLYDKDKGFKAWGSKPGQELVTQFSPQTTNALNTIEGLASQPNPFYGGMADFTNSLITGGQGIDKSGFADLAGKKAITVVPEMKALLSQNANALDQYGRPIASGENGINTEQDFRSLYGAVDSDFNNVVDQTANDLSDQITRQFGGSSYGSPEHTGTIANQVGDTIARMRSQNFNQNLANKTNILGNISGIQGQNIGNQLGAAGMLSGEQLGNRGQQAGILGQVADSQLANRNFQRAIAGDIAGLNQMDIQNRLAGIDRADSVYNSQYLPAERMAQVGNAYDIKAQQLLDARKDKYNQNSMSDWDRLAQYFGFATGAGGQGGQTETTVTQPTNPLSSIIGGGVLASQALF